MAVGGTSLLIFPTLLIHTFKRLSWLNMIGFISTLVVTATMVALLALDPLRHAIPTQVYLLLCAPVQAIRPVTLLGLRSMRQCLFSATL